MRQARRGFTIVELLVVIVIVAILASITLLLYKGMQYRADDARVSHSIAQATTTLDVNYVKQRDYPPNLAGTEYVAADKIAFAMYTNAPQKRVYVNLTANQNAQLLLNSCNAHMPVEQNGTEYNTGCMFSGSNFHIKGKTSSNVLLNGPTINEASFQLSCGSVCDVARQAIVTDFLGQGGTFPVTVSSGNVVMPTPDFATYGKATGFCLEARSMIFDDIVYHTTNDDSRPTSGLCPIDPNLHYP